MRSILALQILFSILFSVESGTNAQNAAFTLEEVCHNENIRKPISFSSVYDVKNLLNSFRQNANLCPVEYHGSILRLDYVLSDKHLNDVCSRETYDAIRDYHIRYISIYTPEASKDEMKARAEMGLGFIPESLRQFFIVFVQKISGMCKQNLIKRFNQEVRNWEQVQINDNGFKLMHILNERARRLAKQDFHKEPKYIEQTLVSSVELSDDQKLNIVVRESQHIVNKVKNVCDGRFRPVYEEIFLPVIRLNNLGYSEDFITHSETKILHNDRSYRRWFTIIETCEQFKNVRLIVDEDQVMRNDLTQEKAGNDRMQIINYDEAQYLLKKIQTKQTNQMPAAVYFDHKPTMFGVSLWSNSAHEIKASVSQFDHQNKKQIHHKTSSLSTLRLKLVSQIEKLKQQWRNRDNTALMGKLSNWYHKHQGNIITAMLIITIASILL